jgi:hypothetical protein
VAEAPDIEGLRGSGSPLLAKMAFELISQDLAADSRARSAFLRDPVGFIRVQYGVVPSPNEEAFFRSLARRYENEDSKCCDDGFYKPPAVGR